MSKDGKPRLSIKVEFRVDFDSVVDAALWKSERDDGWNPNNPPKKRREWINVVREALNSEGVTLWASVEHLGTAPRESFRAVAAKLFPDL